MKKHPRTLTATSAAMPYIHICGMIIIQML